MNLECAQSALELRHVECFQTEFVENSAPGGFKLVPLLIGTQIPAHGQNIRGMTQLAAVEVRPEHRLDVTHRHDLWAMYTSGLASRTQLSL